MIHVGKAQTRWWNNLNCTQDLVSWNPTSVNRHVKSPVILSDLPRAVVDPEKKGFPTKACTGPLFRVYNLHYILKSTTAFTHSLESSLLTGMKHLSNPALFKGLVKLISMESLLAGWRKFVWIFPGQVQLWWTMTSKFSAIFANSKLSWLSWTLSQRAQNRESCWTVYKWCKTET